MYIMAKNKDNSWMNLEGDEGLKNDEELDNEKIKLEIKKKVEELKEQGKNIDSNTNETITNMLSYLSQLQNTEKELYEILKDDNDSTDKRDIINKINNLSTKRDKLYGDMKQMSVDVNIQNKNITNSYSNQLRLISIAENQLNKEKDRLKILNAEKYNKLRMVQINTYYSKRYESLAYVTILVIGFFIITIIINLLTNRGIIPENITNIVSPILISIAIFILFLAYNDFARRSKFNFDEYESVKEDSNGGDDDGGFKIWPEPDIGTCIGSGCCADGTEYDSGDDTCKPIHGANKDGGINDSDSDEDEKESDSDSDNEGFRDIKNKKKVKKPVNIVRPYKLSSEYQTI